MNQSMNDEAVYRTALATLGLLKISSQSNTKTINILVRKKVFNKLLHGQIKLDICRCIAVIQIVQNLRNHFLVVSRKPENFMFFSNFTVNIMFLFNLY